MRCPYCGVNDDKVIDSREAEGGRSIRRRRVCKACGKRFTTYEKIEGHEHLSVLKKDGTRVPFDRSRILSGLEKACYKRPVRAEQLEAVAAEVEDLLRARNLRDVESTDIGLLVAERLKRLDTVAYVRFMSVYLKIETMDDLLAEMQEMRATLPEPDREDQQDLFDG
ncbi:MAG: transcriptional regulator NrdR [Planctomycetota bacterium]